MNPLFDICLAYSDPHTDVVIRMWVTSARLTVMTVTALIHGTGEDHNVCLGSSDWVKVIQEPLRRPHVAITHNSLASQWQDFNEKVFRKCKTLRVDGNVELWGSRKALKPPKRPTESWEEKKPTEFLEVILKPKR